MAATPARYNCIHSVGWNLYHRTQSTSLFAVRAVCSLTRWPQRPKIAKWGKLTASDTPLRYQDTETSDPSLNRL